MKTNKIKQYLALTLFLGLGFFSNVLAQEHKKDSLSYYIELAIENNPGVRAQKYVYEAFLEKIPQAGAFQDPELSLQAYTMPMDIVGGRSIGNVSLMQTLPWFGTRKAARTEAIHIANVQDKQYQQGVDNLIAQVSIQWYTLQKLNEQLRNNQENKELLEQLEQLATRQYSSAATSSLGGMSDVLRIQLEIVELENNIENIHALIKAEKATFNTLLNRPVTEKIMLSQEIYKVDYLYSEAEILAGIEANNPMLGMINEEGLAYKAKAEMDRKMSYPMIGLGVEYMVNGRTDNPMLAMGHMNGKDMIMPMASLSLPIFRKKYNAQQKESQLWWKSSDERFVDTYNTLKSEFYGLKSELDNYARVADLFEKQTTLAQTTYNLVVKEFITGKSDLTNVIQVQRQLLVYQLEKAEAIANYNIMVVSIQKLIAENR